MSGSESRSLCACGGTGWIKDSLSDRDISCPDCGDGIAELLDDGDSGEDCNVGDSHAR